MNFLLKENVMKSLLISILVVCSLSNVAQAGILLEPYFSYILSGKSSADSSAKTTGSVMGARVGWSMLGFSVGLDALLTGTLTTKSDTSSDEIKPSGYGLFVAYAFPIMVRGYLSYFPSYVGKLDSTELTGSGNKLGVQFTGLPFIAIGLEAETVKITKAKTGGTTTDFDNTITFTNLVISAPFNL